MLFTFAAMRKFAISDLHGCNLTFQALLDKIAFGISDELYLLGDYVDRGPDSKGVLDTIFNLKEKGYKVRCLMGNHEHSMLLALRNVYHYYDWLEAWGGRQTMDSFNVDMPSKIPQKYWDFFKKLEWFIQTGDFLLVHAGLNFRAKNPFVDYESLMYLREWYQDIDYHLLGDRYIVHGHTPVSVGQTELQLKLLERQRYIDIDTGCFAMHLPGKGHLCAFDMTNRELFFQKNLDDVSGYWKSR
ncbi:MAG: metallophosphoesterase [Bacteroidota bacterium]